VVQDEVEDDPDATRMAAVNEPLEVLQRSEPRVDPDVVGDVVAEVEIGRRVDRREPDRVDPEGARRAVVQVIEVVLDARQVAEPVAGDVGEAAGIDLIDDPGTPPLGLRQIR